MYIKCFIKNQNILLFVRETFQLKNNFAKYILYHTQYVILDYSNIIL